MVEAPASERVAVPEVKALTFTMLRVFLPKQFGEDGYQRILERLNPDTVKVLEEIQAGAWAPERHMQELMRVVYEDVLDSDDDAFLDFARDLAAVGIGRWLQVFLGLASQRFVLRNIPVVWKRLRRNAGGVTAEIDDDVARLRYEGFPFFGHRYYRLLSLANCQALACAAESRIPPGEIKDWTEDTLVLEFRL